MGDAVVSLLHSLISIEHDEASNNEVQLENQPSAAASAETDISASNANANAALSEEEWKLILGNEKDFCIEFQKGDFIMQEGFTYKTLFQTISGTCNVEKEKKEAEDGSEEKAGTVAAAGREIIARFDAGEVFGEITFFTQ